MKLKLNLFSLILLGLFLCSTSIQAQNAALPDSSMKHQVLIAFDLWGVTALPVSTYFNDIKKSNLRMLGKIQFIHDKNIALDLAFGIDHKELDVVSVNLTNYKMDATYYQIIVSAIPMDNKTLRVLMGAGIAFGNFKESGDIEIGDEYFDPYMETLSFDEPFFGPIFSLKADKKFTKRFSLESDLRLQSINIKETNPVQIIRSVPGGGKSWNNQQGFAVDMNILCSVKYRIF